MGCWVVSFPILQCHKLEFIVYLQTVEVAWSGNHLLWLVFRFGAARSIFEHKDQCSNVYASSHESSHNQKC